MAKIRYVLVLYNTVFSDSKALEFFYNKPELFENLVVLDNSENEAIISANRAEFERLNSVYFGSGGNKGLPRAYNLALEAIKGEEYIMFLDQDTALADTLCDVLQSEITEFKDIKIFVPKVVTKGGKLISPCRLSGHKVLPIKMGGSQIRRGITAINSGLIIRADLLKSMGGYNEKIFLDYADHELFGRLKARGESVKIMDITLTQDFSDENILDEDSALRRFVIYKNDFYIFCSDSFVGRIFYRLKMLYRAKKLDKRFGTKRFSRALKGRADE